MILIAQFMMDLALSFDKVGMNCGDAAIQYIFDEERKNRKKERGF